MSEENDKSYLNRLHPEDQARVDEFIRRGVNSVERKPFRPMRLLLILMEINPLSNSTVKASIIILLLK